ncbi:MAG: hypothetical protein HYZ57_02525, partial [Acidobacteria bacterium]|nr:hypothetical protein [Acidobacteriota bacterium]
TAQCAGGFALTDAGGLATCDLVLGGRIGTAQLTISVGGFTTFSPTFEINVLPGEPAKFNILQGNNQGGRAGQQLPLALVAQVTDAFGNVLPGAQVTWTVATGNSELVNTFRTADQTGRVSTLVRLGTTPGAHQIRVTAGQATATFTANVEASFGALTAVSGSGQQVQINQAFPQPLVVRLTDTQGQPISSIAINFAVASGSATLSSATATTNAQGQASVNVTAGGSPGPIGLTASVGNLSAAFNLSSRLPGPVFALADFMNAASFRRLQAIAPGMLLTISGSGFVPNLQNTITAGTLIGPMPLSLGGVEVLFGSIPAPIFSIAASSGGRQDITVQVPYEIAPGGVASVTIRAAGGGTTTLNNVPAVPFDPGIFEMIAGGQRIAVLVKDDGSVVTSDNPARRGDRLRLFITGIGQTSPGTATNRPGAPGQTPLAPLIVGVNNAGVPLISAEPLTGVVGIFVLTFDVPADTPSGPQITLSVGVVGPDGNPVYSQGSSLPVQ